jgi:DNA-binding IclR family transcriptional regulator
MQGTVSAIAELSGAQSVDRALKLLAIVARDTENGMSLSAIVAESGLNKPTARRLLVALMRARLVEQDSQSRRYHLGDEAFVLGVLASRRHGLLDLSMESLRALSGTTMDSSFLSVRRDNFSVCLYREEGTYPVRTHALQAGLQHPLGIGAGSLAMISALPDPEIEAILAANRAIMAAQYPTYSMDQIRLDIADTRRRGFALNPGRIVTSSWGVGAVFRFPNGRVAGALSIAAIDSRVGPERQPELAHHLKTETARIEAKLRTLFVPQPPNLNVPARARA